MPLFEPVDNLTKLYVPLWWYGQVDKIDDHSPMHCDLTPTNGTKFGEHGYVFDGVNDYLIDGSGRKVICNGTVGEWFSLFLTEGDVPIKGSAQGTGTELHMNIAGTVPKITGKIVLSSRYCPNLTNLNCRINSISVLDVSTLTSLVVLGCRNNLISALDVSALTNLTYIYCSDNSFDQAMVDIILCDVDGYGTNGSVINISGNAVPSVAGITCKNNLIARGWTVTTD